MLVFLLVVDACDDELLFFFVIYITNININTISRVFFVLYHDVVVVVVVVVVCSASQSNYYILIRVIENLKAGNNLNFECPSLTRQTVTNRSWSTSLVPTKNHWYRSQTGHRVLSLPSAFYFFYHRP